MAVSAKAVANFFLDLAEQAGAGLSPMKLQKLVYYAHGWHLGLTGKPLIDESVEAWPYGPVIASLYHEFKHFGNRPITSKATEFVWPSGAGRGPLDIDQVTPEVPSDDSEESKYTRELLRRVWDVYGGYSPTQLSNLTHEPDGPWHQISAAYRNAIPKGTHIADSSIREFFAEQAATS